MFQNSKSTESSLIKINDRRCLFKNRQILQQNFLNDIKEMHKILKESFQADLIDERVNIEPLKKTKKSILKLCKPLKKQKQSEVT